MQLIDAVHCKTETCAQMRCLANSVWVMIEVLMVIITLKWLLFQPETHLERDERPLGLPTDPYFQGCPVFWHLCPASRLMPSQDT